MYTIVTGAAGFIGSNLVKELNARGVADIIAVDNLTQGDKYRNLVDCEIADYLDKNEFIARITPSGSLTEFTSGITPVSRLPARNSPDSSIKARIPWYCRVQSRDPHSVYPSTSSTTCVSMMQSSPVTSATFFRQRMGSGTW